MAKQTEAKRGSDLPKVPRLVSETEFVPVWLQSSWFSFLCYIRSQINEHSPALTPSGRKIIPTVVLHSDPTILSLSPKEGVRVGSALLADPSRDVHRWALPPFLWPCTVSLWCLFQPLPCQLPSLGKTCLLFTLFVSASALLSCSPHANLSFSFLQNTVFQPLKFLAFFQTFSYLLLILQNAWGWFLRQPEAVTSVLMCHH